MRIFLFYQKIKNRIKKFPLQFVLKFVITVPVCNKSCVWLGKMCVCRVVTYKIIPDVNR